MRRAVAQEIPGASRRRCRKYRSRAWPHRRSAGTSRASRSGDDRADCRRGRCRYPAAGSRAAPCAAPARCRRRRSGSPESDNPSSAAGRPPSRADGNSPPPCRRRGARAPRSRAVWLRPRPGVRRPELIKRPSPRYASSPIVKRISVLAWRQDHRHDRKPVLARKLQVALIVCGAAEDRAGAVLHQHEIGDVDRQLLLRTSGLRQRSPVSWPIFSACSIASSLVAVRAHSAANAAMPGSAAASAAASG